MLTAPRLQYHEVRGRPGMGQPLSDVLLPGSLPEMGMPGQYGVAAAEALPSFREYMHQQVDALRRGDVNVGTFRDFWRAAGSLSYCGYDIHETYVAPDGMPLVGPDEEAADLLWRMREPGSWMLRHDTGEPQAGTPQNNKLTAEDLSCVAEVFRHYDGVCELDIEADELDRIAAARKLVASTLGIDGHGRFSLGELAQKITARLELSDAVASGAFTELFRSVAPPQRRAIAVVAMPNAVPAPHRTHPQPLSRGGTTATAPQEGEESDPSEPRPLVIPSQPASRRRRLEGFDDGGHHPLPGQREIRSHVRRSRYPARLRRAVAAIALTAVVAVGAFFTMHEVADHRPSTPAITKLDPRPAITKPPLIQTPSIEQQPPADHVISIGGDYDPVARTGAIWFNVQDYAAELGYSNLTMLQTYLLTDKCMQYMNAKIPGGMGWDQATRIASNAQLPYPPASTMRSMISEVMAQTGAAPNYYDAT